MDLREALEKMTNGGEIAVAEHEAAVAVLFKITPHGIVLREVARGMPHNCFQYALDVANSEMIADILIRDRGRSARDVKFGSAFMGELIDAGALRPHPRGNIVVYFAGDRIVHAGKKSGGRVTSKWGIGHLWEHGLWEVPSSYGHRAEIYQLTASLAEIEHLFGKHYAALPIVGDRS